MKTYRIIRIVFGATMMTAASALLLSGCAKDGGDEFDAILNFSVDVPEIFEVKAAAETSVSNFYTIGYDGTTQWFPDPSKSTDPVNVVISGTAAFGDYKWKMGTSRTFYAYSNNLPSGATAAIANTGVTLTYTAIPTDAANQTDVTLGRYSGNGNNEGKAAMTFYHPLAQVVFKMGDMVGVSKIDKIEIKGVYSVGTTTLSTDTGTTDVTPVTGSGTVSIANFSWTNISGSATVSQTITGALPSKDSEIGVPFMLIPQNLATQNATVSVTVTTTGGSSVTLTKKLESGSLATGRKTVCTLTVNPVTSELGCTLIMAYFTDTKDNIFQLPQPDDEIWYTTSDGNIMQMSSSTQTNNAYFGAKLVSNTYSGGKGILKFDGTVTKIGVGAFSSINNFKEIHLPSNVAKFESCSFTSLSGTSPAVIHIPDGFKVFEQGSFYHIDEGNISQIRIVTSTHEYLLKYIFDNLRLEPNGETSFIVMPQNITFDNGMACCFAKGILITLADGSQKKVEDLTYSDKLKVWNFDEGEDDSANILWITKAGLKAEYFFRCTLSDGTVLDLIGEEDEGTHRLFNKTAGKFEYPDQMAPGSKVYTEHGLVEVVSFERIDEEVEYYNLITDKDINCYANEVLTSCRYNNIYPIDENMKFIKDGRKKRPYKEFKAAGISREWYVGMRLGEQPYDIEDIAKYIGKCEAHMAEKPNPSIWQRFKTWWRSIFE